MKKYFLTFAFIAFGYLSFCQDFATIYSNRDAMYTNSNWRGEGDESWLCSSGYSSTAVDSTKIIGTSTIYYHHNILRITPETSSCSQFKKLPNWTGSTTTIKNTGENIFLTNTGDSIRIKARAELNDAWHFYDFPNGDYFEAALTAKTEGNALSTIDSIKAITITLKDNLGNTVSNDFNGKQLMLSKNHGMLRAYDFSRFPNDTSAFILCGISNPAMGIQNLTAKEIFNYDIGDEFHIEENNSWPPTSGTFRKERRIVLTKNNSANLDTITYKIQRVLITHYYNWQNYTHDSSTIKDTVTEKIILSDLKNLDRTPLKLPVSVNDFSVIYCLFKTGHNNRLAKTPNEFHPFNDPCFEPPIYSMPVSTYYFEGLGEYYEGDYGVSQNHKRLLYYKKGTEIGGTEDPLLAIRTHDKSELNFSFAPNPFSDYTTLTIATPGKRNYELHLIDMYGKIVKDYTFDEDHLIIHNDGNLKGLYLYKLYSDKKEAGTGRLIFY